MKNVEGLEVSKRILYEKQGRRYVPVHEYDPALTDGLPRGDHLISVYPGGSSRRYHVDPALAPMIAAGRVAEDAVCRAMIKASELRPQQTPITPEQRAAWEALALAFGTELCTLQSASVRDCAEAGIKALQAEADKLITNPAVKQAYDRFLFVAALTKEHNGNNPT